MKILPYLHILTAFGIGLFWSLYYLIGISPKKPTVCYSVYESSFPLPDSFILLCLFLSGILNLSGKLELGKNFALFGSGGLMFLGLVDFSYNIQYGGYFVSETSLYFKAIQHSWCVILALVTLFLYSKNNFQKS